MNYTFFDHTRLMSTFDHCIEGTSWWASVQHGMGLLGVCAPLTAIRDIRNLYIASSATRDKAQGLGLPWGSHPLIDGNVAWADVKAIHDCPEWCRQEKIRYAIKPFIELTNHYPRFIVCNDTGRRHVLNCGRCEKCCRTIVGLALEGIDPNRCGFHIDGRTFPRIKQKLLWGPLRFTHRKSGLWWDIRACIPGTITGDLYGSRAFFEWLRTHEFAEDGGKYRPFSQRMLERCLKLGLIR